MEIPILYEDKYLIVCQKPAGVPSQPDITGQDDCLSHLQKKYKNLKLVHRLDIPTGGVMVYAKDQNTAGKLSHLVSLHDPDGIEGMAKTYIAVLDSEPDFEEGSLFDLLFHDKIKNRSFPADRKRNGVKEAKLIWKKLAVNSSGNTLISVTLLTGRTHQIRAQFSSRGTPLFGDGKYGSHMKCQNIALWSHCLSFTHPFTNERITCKSLPDASSSPWCDFDLSILQ